MEFNKQQIQASAKITFLNVLLLSFIFLVIDIIRTKWIVDRPVKKIISGLNQIIQGDYSIEINTLRSYENGLIFNPIIEHINRMTKELNSVEMLKTDFISSVSHEMKTPLAVIHNYGSLLEQEGISDEKRKEYAKAISHTSSKLADLISNILKLNKLENQSIYPNYESYSLDEQLRECILNHENEWSKKNLLLEIELDSIQIQADRELLSLVWNNLISNAIKFTEKKGSISIQLKYNDAETIAVSVKDTGCGMSRETGKHIFDKFYQGNTAHSTEGNGLGLSLVKRVVEILHGEIQVHSELGKGTEFTVLLKAKLNE